MKSPAVFPSILLVGVCFGAVNARGRQPASPLQLTEAPVQLAPSEIKIYKDAQTLIDWTPSQIHTSPFLCDVRTTGNQDQLAGVLEHVGQTVTQLFHDFPQVACDEEVISDRIKPFKNVTLADEYPMGYLAYYPRARHEFRYIVIPHPSGNAPGFEEYRTNLKGTPLDASILSSLFTVTSNHTTTCLYLSPADQHDNRFRYFGLQTIRERECHVVGFAQEPEKARRVGAFHVGNKSAIMLIQGVAWIDSETFQILRVTTWLLAPRRDIGISRQVSTVDFYPIRLEGAERVLWLPRDVTVETDYQLIRACNEHHYSNFKLFRVDTAIKP